MSIYLNTNATSPPLTVSAPGGLNVITLTDTKTNTSFDLSFEDMATLVSYFFYTPEYSKGDPRLKLFEKLENSNFIKGLNGGMIKLKLNTTDNS